MEQAFSRTELLLGSSALERLAASRVAVFGIGGVGGYVCEALARTGVGHLDLIDSDTAFLFPTAVSLCACRHSNGDIF